VISLHLQVKKEHQLQMGHLNHRGTLNPVIRDHQQISDLKAKLRRQWSMAHLLRHVIWSEAHNV